MTKTPPSPRALVTGAAGFFGSILCRHLEEAGWQVIGLDRSWPGQRVSTEYRVIGDVRRSKDWDRALQGGVDVIFHSAALLAHEFDSDSDVFTTNAAGTQEAALAARRHGVPQLVHVSTNCLWGHPLGHPVAEKEAPNPVGAYGKSKLEAEKRLQPFFDELNVVILRVPTIIAAGRLGLLGILFEFIDDNCRIWLPGGGKNRYQFIAAEDLCRACMLAAAFEKSDVFHLGAHDVPTLRATFDAVIRRAQSGSRVVGLPVGPSRLLMTLAHKARLSPLGPYHIRMISEDFIFNTDKAKRVLGFVPTLSNTQMLQAAFNHYRKNRGQIESRQRDHAAHRRVAEMGVIRLLKWIS
jgi:nucleoside-diphosphate-sugar epimerase